MNNREANQQQRTANGLRSGKMTSGEAARTNRNQAKVAQQVHNERTANGGALTAQQKQQANREENKNSRQIYNEKHNDKHGKARSLEPLTRDIQWERGHSAIVEWPLDLADPVWVFQLTVHACSAGSASTSLSD